MRKEIASLHYLTQDLPLRTHEEQVRIACDAGVKWIQLRVKNKSFDEWLAIAERARRIVDRFDVTLIINDSVEIAKAVNADGVHLGQEDLSPEEARKILGDEKLIGFSTHSLNEMLAVKNFDVDYFGFGPFRFTSTKEKLDPVLGADGIKAAIYKARMERISKPIIAIGGIQLDDVEELFNCGVNGIAISSSINLANDPKQMIALFQQKLQISNLNIAKRSPAFQ